LLLLLLLDLALGLFVGDFVVNANYVIVIVVDAERFRARVVIVAESDWFVECGEMDWLGFNSKDVVRVCVCVFDGFVFFKIVFFLIEKL
jgi:hypothetical protein